MKASELAKKIGGYLIGELDPELTSVAALNDAGEAQVAFLHNPKYKEFLYSTGASSVVLTEDNLPEKYAFAPIIHPDPHLAMSLAIDLLYPPDELFEGIHPTAVIDLTATLGKNVSVGPNSYIGAGCIVGDGSRIYAGAVLISNIHIGPGCIIYPSVTIYPKTWLGSNVTVHANCVLGSDGFGFSPTNDNILKIRQVGRLVIEDDVEIGACCTLDRGTLTETRVGRGTKLDNAVHIGHNCRIGEFCLVAAQTGLSGSTIIGDRVMVGGQVGFAGHQKIGDGSIIYAKSGVKGDIPPKSKLFGYPAKDHIAAYRENTYISRLGLLFKRVEELEKLLEMKKDK